MQVNLFYLRVRRLVGDFSGFSEQKRLLLETVTAVAFVVKFSASVCFVVKQV